MAADVETARPDTSSWRVVLGALLVLVVVAAVGYLAGRHQGEQTGRTHVVTGRTYVGLNETTVGSWVKKYRIAHAADEPPLELSERARLRELERRTRELEIENAFLKKAAAHFAREQR